MVELTSRERLLPSLLDRLTDEQPREWQESRQQRVGSMATLRQAVLRDLEWLLNTVNIESTEDLDAYPELRETVLNYGLEALAGSMLAHREKADVLAMIRQAIQAFEPRILKNTVRVTLVEDDDHLHRNVIAFEIEGTLWGRPMPEALFLRTELDLELGDVRVSEA